MKLSRLIGSATLLLGYVVLAPQSVMAQDSGADSIVVLANHAEPKPHDPVIVNFQKFKVIKAKFDPQKVEGGTATIEIDATSLTTGQVNRDVRLQSPDFMDTSKFTTITLVIDHVKRKSGKFSKIYTAAATVRFRDITKKYPVSFEVTEQTPNSIRIKGESTFNRLDFKVGRDSKSPKEAPVANDLTIRLNLTLKNA